MFECIQGAYRGRKIFLESNGCRHQMARILENQESYPVEMRINMGLITEWTWVQTRLEII